ncbi:hypothetical protein ACSLBF_03235 [Pseudoalteromonas sp. T1lg65]|uniref:hypothetical protein n=1 Tax=Pseudoalteromonas sp. T1lg65 TaxID=2077101 RepID=UPI003F78C3EF
MKLKQLKLLCKGLILQGVLSTPLIVSAATEYKTEICYSCTASNALEFAKKYPPEIQCYTSGPFDYDYTQECYSQSKDVLIVNANSKQKWYFKLSHGNQGAYRHELALHAQPKSLPSDANSLVDELLRYYAAWDKAVAGVSEKYQAQAMQLAPQNKTKNTFSATASSPNNCQNEPISRAAYFAFDAGARADLHRSLVSAFIKEYGSVNGAFETKRTTGFGYSVGRDSVSIAGNFEYVPATRSTRVDFHDPVNGGHTIVYNVFSGERGSGLDFELAEDMSFLGGKRIKDLGETRPSEVSNCMLEVLNKYLKASIQGDSSSPGGSAISYPAGYDRIPRRYSGGGSGGSFGPTCTWTFYDPFGSPYMQLEGPCP